MVHGVTKSQTWLNDWTEDWRGKFIAIQAYLKKQEKYQLDNLILHLKQLKKNNNNKNPKLVKEKKKKENKKITHQLVLG